jgi:hypothetical protein
MSRDDRDEFIYTKVFNNHNIPKEVPIDFSIGTLEEWIRTCEKFNNGEKILNFASIYIVYNTLICNNVHPFTDVSSSTHVSSITNVSSTTEINCITQLLSTYVIHD